VRALAESGCERPIVFLTGRGDIPMSVRAMRAGAVNFLTKPVATRGFCERPACAGEGFHDPSRSSESWTLSCAAFKPSPRARARSLRQVISGRLDIQIAGDLGTVEKTIKAHRAG
jgi:FixJ family two-component response regulator